MQIETSNMILKKNLQTQIAAFEEGLAIRKRMLALLQEGEGIEQSPTTNWLRQLKPQLDFFVVADGWVKLRDNLPQLDEKYANGEENVGNAVPQEHLE